MFVIESAELGADGVDLANGSGGHLALEFGDKRVVAVHEAFHQVRAGALDEVRQFQRFLSVGGQRLLAEDVASAGVEAALDLLPVLVGPGGQDHAVQVLVADHLLVVGVPGLAVVGLGPLAGHRLADVAAGDELKLFRLQAGATVAGTDSATSNDANTKGREIAG